MRNVSFFIFNASLVLKIKKAFSLFICVSVGIIIEAQKKDYKFDFGSGETTPGYIQVTPETKFTYQRGYGIDQESAVKSVDRGGHLLKGDFLTSSKPFYFSVKLPEGNYDVKVLLGDTKGTSATTVKVENRRLMLENICTSYGVSVSQTFTVHIRDSLIRGAGGKMIDKIKLKPREVGYLHWDNLLTIEFTDSLPKVCAVEITPNKTATTVFLAGNSTVVDQDREPWAAWGQMFPRFLIPGKVAVANYAESGETLLAFMREKRLEKIWSMAKPGDYLFVEFAHNDQKPGSNFLDPFSTYKQTLKEWISEARKRKIIPVLVTSMHRRNFDSSGDIINTLSDYPEAMRQTAKEEKANLIDLNAMSKILYEAWGETNSIRAFVHYPANTFPDQPVELKDNTHFNPYGAYELAKCVIHSIKKQNLSLNKFVRNEVLTYDPAYPLPFEKFYWPESLFKNSVKPDGN